jgi:hypothetical protein
VPASVFANSGFFGGRVGADAARAGAADFGAVLAAGFGGGTLAAGFGGGTLAAGFGGGALAPALCTPLGAGGLPDAPGFGGVPDARTAYAAGGGAGRLDGFFGASALTGGRCESGVRRCAAGTSDSGGGGGGDALRVESRWRICAAGGGGALELDAPLSAGFAAFALASAASMSDELNS